MFQYHEKKQLRNYTSNWKFFLLKNQNKLRQKNIEDLVVSKGFDKQGSTTPEKLEEQVLNH